MKKLVYVLYDLSVLGCLVCTASSWPRPITIIFAVAVGGLALFRVFEDVINPFI